MENYLLMFLSTLITSLILTPAAERLSYLVGAIDQPNHRKVHEDTMPRLGGLAIYISFVVNSLIFIELAPSLQAILAGSVIIVIVGIIDDISGLTAGKKLAGQLLAVVPILSYNLQANFIGYSTLDLPFSNYLGAVLTVLWIVGLINAINLIDGLDGLAAGISMISAVSIVAISVIQGSIISLGLALILAASTLGFLNYNFNPAQIFMGDTGSMFLGYALATISIVGMVKSATIITIFSPVLVLGVPIFDTGFAFVRRLIVGEHPFRADKEHIHHRFLNFGLNHKQTVLTIYLIAIVFGMTAVILARYHNLASAVMALFILTVLFYWLKEFEIIGLKPTEREEPVEILKEIRYNLVELERAVDNELELAGLHEEINQLEELVEKVPDFVYDEAQNEIAVKKEKVTYNSLRERIVWLTEIIDLIIDNYQYNSDNLNYIFQEEKGDLINIYNRLSKDLKQEV